MRKESQKDLEEWRQYDTAECMEEDHREWDCQAGQCERAQEDQKAVSQKREEQEDPAWGRSD